ncbi:hypothetical protein [Cryobacterium sp. Y50]|uniref:hypothetical protein n=1 Tax=Cryobacterium sp. Y50 TaxID=2048286 RepID=UPI0011AFD6CD|nr:hypothetical protein [Cryobacterium sp. Y50]
MKILAPLAIVAALLLSGCSSSPADSEPQETAPVAESGVDVTADVTAGLDADTAALVTSAEEVAPGELEIETSIVDPRGDNGSAEALSAITICEAATNLEGTTFVRVAEDDGTSFVMYSPDSPAALDQCTEY